MKPPDRIFVGPEAMAYTKRLSDGDEEYVRAALVVTSTELAPDERAELELRRFEGKEVSDMLGLPETTTIDAIVAAIGELKQKVSRWVPVAERLPQSGTLTLVGYQYTHSDEPEKIHLGSSWYDFEDGWELEGGSIKVVCWLSNLPSFPEKG